MKRKQYEPPISKRLRLDVIKEDEENKPFKEKCEVQNSFRGKYGESQIASFIRSNFKIKECSKFIPKPSEPNEESQDPTKTSRLLVPPKQGRRKR